MCMFTDQYLWKTADRNILVAKSSHIRDISVFTFKSCFRNFLYKRFKTYYTEVKKLHTDDDVETLFLIEEGFHSFINLDVGNAYFIIPKGANYFEGADNDSTEKIIDARVSDKIIYIGRKNRITRLIARVFYNA